MGFDICRQSWLAPWISQFSWLFQETLHAAAMTPGDVENGVRHPHESPKFQAFLSHLVLGSREERRLLKTNESFPLRDVFHLVDLRYADISPGDSSTTPFAESDTKRRAHIVYAVCHHAEQTDEFIEALRSIEPSDARVEPFAFDRNRNQYYHFGNDDGRVYRQAAPTKNEPDGRFELVCDGVQSTLSFIKTLDRTNPAERELREQLQMLLPDLIAVEEREVKRSQKKATMSSVSQSAAARPHSIRQSRVERELARQEEERLEQEELARKRAERADELSEMSSALILELSRRTAARYSTPYVHEGFKISGDRWRISRELLSPPGGSSALLTMMSAVSASSLRSGNKLDDSVPYDKEEFDSVVSDDDAQGDMQRTKAERLMLSLEMRDRRDHLQIDQMPAVMSQIQAASDAAAKIHFSGNVTKLNRRHKAQDRVLVITNSVILNMKPQSYTIKRVIAIDHLSSVSLSDSSPEFVIHVNGEYDYWYSSLRRGEIIRTLAEVFQAKTGRELEAEISQTKNMALIMVHKTGDALRKRIMARSPTASKDPMNATGLTQKIRCLVSKKKVRYQQDDFDLDLTYITDRLIAMGFPSDDIDGIYRNPFSEVYRFLETRHAGAYKVYNLCSERTYEPSKFHRRVALFPFEDHNVPNIDIILEFCRNVASWLKTPGNVAAVHCKAGKGRTGLMLSCFLLYSQMFPTAEQALEYFGRKRTHNGKGVTIPSQRRFCLYFERFLRDYYGPDKPFSFVGVPLVITNIHLASTPRFGGDNGCNPYFKASNAAGERFFDSRKSVKIQHKNGDKGVDLTCLVHVRGNVKLEFFDQDQYKFDTPMFHFWLNTSFIEHNYIKLEKFELDKAHKDRDHKKFDPDFAVEVFFRPDDAAVAQVEKDDDLVLNATKAEDAELAKKVERLEQRIADLETLRLDLQNQNSLFSLQVDELREENDQLKQENATLRAAAAAANKRI
ncbi:unnamed protein product (mitochondrion) [Plasmodiophora brassicae]|uniref:Phosphatidylinositol-3,4,5-trisphosphate 3-phosphatase n=1 Tax=Plasmodiophora brassicae TaxID=37360 RepID=A0A3P3YID2_PLABS|nr:unnamed protein product [Plasmodiophora brassicae]